MVPTWWTPVMIWFFILHYGIGIRFTCVGQIGWCQIWLLWVVWFLFCSVSGNGILAAVYFILHKKTKIMSIFSIMFLWNFSHATVQSIWKDQFFVKKLISFWQFCRSLSFFDKLCSSVMIGCFSTRIEEGWNSRYSVDVSFQVSFCVVT
jgi:hypothetical protein